MFRFDGVAVLLTEHGFQQHFNGERQAGYVAYALFFQGLQSVVLIRFVSNG